MRGDLIEALRRSKNMSQNAFAKKLNVSRQTVYNWETNTSSPAEDKLIEIAKIFNVPQEVFSSDPKTVSTESVVIESLLSGPNAPQKSEVAVSQTDTQINEVAPQQNQASEEAVPQSKKSYKKKIVILSSALVLFIFLPLL